MVDIKLTQSVNVRFDAGSVVSVSDSEALRLKSLGWAVDAVKEAPKPVEVSISGESLPIDIKATNEPPKRAGRPAKTESKRKK